MKTLHGDTQELSDVIARASELAESVSSKVRVLDLAKASRPTISLNPLVPDLLLSNLNFQWLLSWPYINESKVFC